MGTNGITKRGLIISICMEEGTSREILAMVSASVTRVRGGSGNRKVKMNGEAIKA